MNRKRVALILVLLAAACGDQPSQTGQAAGLPVDTLSAALSIGVELGDSTNTFGVIQDALVLPDSRLLVLDRQSACMKLFDSDGEYVRQLSRRGGGPGELNMPWELFLMPDGRLLVLEMMKQGYVVFDEDLQFTEEISHWAQNPPMLASPLSDSTFSAYKIDTDMVDERIVMNRRIVVYRVGEQDYDTVLWEDSLTATPDDIMENPSMFVTDLLDAFCLAGDENGTVYFAEKSGEVYEILGWNSSGAEVFRATMALEPVPKTPEEIEEEKAYMNRFFAGMGGGMSFDFEPEPNRNMIVALGIGPGGNVWAQRGTTDTPFFDIFDTSGNLLGHAVFPEPGWSWTFSISPRGILAWEADPPEGYQVLHLLQ